MSLQSVPQAVSFHREMDKHVHMPCEPMLELLAVSDLEHVDRQYTPAGGWIKGLSGLMLSVLLLPVIFLAVAMPATAFGRVNTESSPWIAAGMLALIVAVTGRVVWKSVRRWWRQHRLVRQRADAWDVPFQCLARLAPHVGRDNVVFSMKSPQCWALGAEVDDGILFEARFEQADQGSELQTRLWIDGEPSQSTTRRWHKGPGGWVDQDQEAVDDLPLAVSQAFARALTPGVIESTSAHYRLSLWHSLNPLKVSWALSSSPEPDSDQGFLAELLPRPEAETHQPRTLPTLRALWGGVASYTLSSVAVLGFWTALAGGMIPGLWTQTTLADAVIMMTWPLLGGLITLGALVRGRPPLPRRSPRRVRAQQMASSLHLDQSVIYTDDAQHGVDLERPFAVVFTREERGEQPWALLGVDIHQHQEPERAVRFCVPISDLGAHFTELEALTLDASIMRPEDFRDVVWPLIRHQAELLGQPVPWVLEETFAERRVSVPQYVREEAR